MGRVESEIGCRPGSLPLDLGSQVSHVNRTESLKVFEDLVVVMLRGQAQT